MEVFVYEMPSSGRPLFIGPFGAKAGDLTVKPEPGGLGTLFPMVLEGVKHGFPFTMSFQPHADYPFRGWQLLFSDGTESFWDINDWDDDGDGVKIDEYIRWSPRNASGLEMSITIQALPDNFVTERDEITIMPLGGDSGNVEVRIMPPTGWGSAFPSGNQTSFSSLKRWSYICRFL